jgi:hypothetical protein
MEFNMVISNALEELGKEILFLLSYSALLKKC